MGGRGSTSGGRSGGVNPANISGLTSLVSERGRATEEVDGFLGVMRDIEEEYGVTVTDALSATFKGKDQSVLGFYDEAGNIAINQAYLDDDKMNAAADRNAESGYHPGRGDKTGIEAVTAHEAGHLLTEEIGRRLGLGDWQLNEVSNRIVRQAAKATGKSVGEVRAAVSGYAVEGGNVETVAEAFADVYCNGNKATRESREIVNIMNSYLK